MSRGAPAAWTPAELTNQYGWWRAGDWTTSGGNVVTVTDLFGSAGDLAVVGNAPAANASNATFNGQPSIDFVAASTESLVRAFDIQVIPNTIFCAWSTPSTTSQNIYDSASVAARNMLTKSTIVRAYAGSYITLSGSTDIDTAIKTCVVYDSTSSDGYYQDFTTPAVLGGNPGVNGISGLTLGANYNRTGAWFDGSIAEIIICNDESTADEIRAVGDYFNARYGMTG